MHALLLLSLQSGAPSSDLLISNEPDFSSLLEVGAESHGMQVRVPIRDAVELMQRWLTLHPAVGTAAPAVPTSR